MRAKDKKALKKLFKENAPLAITKVAVDYTAINLILIHFSSSILWMVSLGGRCQRSSGAAEERHFESSGSSGVCRFCLFLSAEYWI